MSNTICFNSYDGTELKGDFFLGQNKFGALLVHGITSERTEAGFYTNIAESLQEEGVNSLLLDLRGHGESAGEDKDFLLSGAISDICAGIDKLRSFGSEKIILIAASFSGGLSIRASELQEIFISHLVLLNPRLNYLPWIKDPIFWKNNSLTVDAQKSLADKGYIVRNGFKLSKAMVNELLTFDPVKGIGYLNKPILFIHGTDDTVIPIEETRAYYKNLKMCKMIEIKGAQHGFTDPNTDDVKSSKSKEIRNRVNRYLMSWISNNFLV